MYYVDELESCAFIVPASIYLMHFTEEDLLEYTKKAEKGNAYAQYYLAKAYLDEEYPGKDIEKGIYWLEKACEQQTAAPYRAAGSGVFTTGSFVTFQTSSPNLLSQRCSLPVSTTVAVKM